MNKVFLFLSVALVTGCSQSDVQDSASSGNESTEIKAVQKVEIPPQGSLSGDTISMNGTFVLFYGPAISDTVSSPELKSFFEISAAVIDSLNYNTTISAQYTTVNNIRIFNRSSTAPMVIMRNTFQQPVGMVLSDGLQPPLIKKGYGSQEDYQKLINNYFLSPS